MTRPAGPQDTGAALRRGLSTLAVLSLASVGILRLEAPPVAADLEAPEREFSASRALVHLERVARRPHPTGSAAAAAVREYLVETLSSLGIETDVQEVRSHWDWIFGRFHNVIARLPGRESAPAVLLVAHYDTSPTTPGAGDNSMAVATLVETLRALSVEPQLERDVVALFTDGEEAGHLGMLGYLASLSSPDEVAFAINLDASGTRGPVYLADTSPGDADVIRSVAHAVRYPRASSIAKVLNRLDPLTSDFTDLKAAGIPGVYFAHATNPVVGHSMLDRIDRVDARTVQHQGETVLSLARHWSDRGRLGSGGEDPIFFSILGRWLVHYGNATGVVLAVVVLIFTTAIVAVGRRRGRVSGRGLMAGAVALVALVIAAPAVATMVSAGLESAEFYGQWLSGYGYRPGLRLAMTTALTVALFGLLFGLALRRHSELDVLAGTLATLAIMLVAITWLAPGGSYLLAWPLAASSLAVAPALLARAGAHDRRSSSAVSSIVATLAGLVALTLFLPVLALSPSLQTSTAPVLTIPLSILLVFLLPALLSLVRLGWSVAFAGGVGAVLGGAALIALARFDAAHPRTNFLVYGADPETQTAIWAGAGSRLDVTEPRDPWLFSVLGEDARVGPLEDYYAFLTKPRMYLAPAPWTLVQAPSLELDTARVTAEGRLLRFRVRSPPDVLSTVIHLDGEIESVTVDGMDHPSVSRTPVIGYLGMPPEGISVEVQLRGHARLELATLGFTMGLPPSLGVPARPHDVMPEPTGGLWAFSDATIVRRSHVF